MANNPRHKENLKPFPKGTSGNPDGRPKLPDLDELMAEALSDEVGGKTAAKQIIEAQRAKAKMGDLKAAEWLFNRGYGLPKQKFEGAFTIMPPINIPVPDEFKNTK